MKLKESFLIILFFLPFISAKRTYNALPSHGRFTFKLFKCEPTEETLTVFAYPNYTCYAKSWSRTVSTINGYILLRRPISEGYCDAVLYYKYGTIYREIIKLQKFELCNLLELSKNNIMLRQIFVAAMAAAPGFVHPCPYEVIEAYNVSFPTHVLFSLFPQGDYKAIIKFYYEINGPVLSTITVIGTAESSVKESFG
ncbi:hypothetical protein PVAND_014840 [Polypedilum vanderplanki]|uniref:Uncharacterized protein n=1 Tax=Polypedilum vanderplanki TaxID=319348 RepID=A0A9J6BB63_POLVA|nr:hypothetical protein PVAND_014840 [Polypedilum vanderplanki]